MFRKIEIGENFLNLIKNIFKKPIGNIILNGKRLKAFLLRVGNKAKMSVLTTPYLM